MFDTQHAPVFVVQSSEFARVDYEASGVTIIATITALHDYADHWQARIRIEFQACENVPGRGVMPRYQTHTEEARDLDRDLLAQWLSMRVRIALSLLSAP